jgi:XTP/dITP diphosphohydrolase
MATLLVVATSNPGKLHEIQAYFSDEQFTHKQWELRLKPPELEIEETGLTFLENAQLKASQVALAVGQWAIADDSGLAVEALGGAPGIYSARYGANDPDRIERLLTALAGVENRQARFFCAIAIANPKGEIILQTEGICLGEILEQTEGEGGFGYDPIFYVPSHQQTFAQMEPGLKHRISHRGQAFAQILPQLNEIKL